MTKLKNRVISIYDRKTSMRLAEEEWTAFDDICRREGVRRKRMLELLDENRSPDLGLTCYVRLFTVAYMYNLIKSKTFKNGAIDGNGNLNQILALIS